MNDQRSGLKPVRPGRLVRPARRDTPELMDDPANPSQLVEGALSDLARVNRFLGGVSLTLQGLRRVAAGQQARAGLSILDVGTGGADIPRAVSAWARGRGLRARVVATDVNPAMLSLARQQGAEGITFAAGDARRLPFRDGSFDVATCSLILHHMGPPDAVLMFKEMGRVARLGVVVNDLVRCWHGYWGAWLLSRGLTRNKLTRHDGPVSTLRAYTREEMADLARQAGLQPVAFKGFVGYRVAMTAKVSSGLRS